MHRHLRPENILLAKGLDYSDIRIINFPITLDWDNNNFLNEKFESPYFLAPEMFTVTNKPNEKSDSWSCGAILYLLISGKVPFDGATDNEIIKNIKAGGLKFSEPIWGTLSDNAKDLISKMLTNDLEKRISINDALMHPWIL